MSSSISFEPIMKKLDKQIHVLAPDLRGMGQSTFNGKINKIENLTEDIFFFLYNQ